GSSDVCSSDWADHADLGSRQEVERHVIEDDLVSVGPPALVEHVDELGHRSPYLRIAEWSEKNPRYPSSQPPAAPPTRPGSGPRAVRPRAPLTWLNGLVRRVCPTSWSRPGAGEGGKLKSASLMPRRVASPWGTTLAEEVRTWWSAARSWWWRTGCQSTR